MNDRKLDGGNACIYIVKDSEAIYYVGKSESKNGVIGRLEQHLWLERRSAGNYIVVYLSNKTVKTFLEQFAEYVKKHERRQNNETIAHIYVGGLIAIHSVRREYGLRWGTDSTLGAHILNNLPDSFEWEVMLLDIVDCDSLIKKSRGYTTPSMLFRSAEKAEPEMIRILRPILNVTYNNQLE